MPFIESPEGRIFYHKMGSGSKAIIALHGYGRDGADFTISITQWEKDVTFYAVDLPFHGLTGWKRSLYNKGHLKGIIDGLLEQEGINQFTAVGHSLGGRLWLAMAPYFEERLTVLWLLAPDGITTRNRHLYEYWPISFRSTLAKILQYPNTLLRIANMAHQLSIIDARAVRFLAHQLSEKIRWTSMVNTWKSISYFRLNKKELKRQMEQHPFHSYFVIGERDQVIDIRKMEKWINGIDNASFVLLKQVSHQSVVARSLAVILDQV